MPYYESVFVARQDISAQQVESLAENLQSVVSDNGGKVTKQENWGIKGLAYKIKKNRKGHYVLFNIDGPSGAVSEMERHMRFNEDILRYMTIKVDDLEEGESVQMQNRSSRDERRPRREEGASFDRNSGAPEPAETASEEKAEKPAQENADEPAEEPTEENADETAETEVEQEGEDK